MSASLEQVFRWTGPVLPLLVALALWLFVRRRRRVAAALGDRALVARLVGEDLAAVPWARVLAVLAAALALGIALADPRWGEAVEGVERQGGRVVLVLDASSSMLAEDLRPNRLERQREAARMLARGLPDAAVAVVVFAGRAYALVPPTTDRGALELYLEALDPAMVTQTGSSLSAAIRQGIGLLAAGGEDPAAGALVLVSDGDAVDEPGQLQETLQLADRAGVPIYTLGAGTAAGAPVPDVDLATSESRGFKRQPGGELIVSRLNEGVMRDIARQTGGDYASLETPGAVGGLIRRLRERRVEAEGGSDRPPPRYAWFATSALALLVLESVWTLRVRPEGA